MLQTAVLVVQPSAHGYEGDKEPALRRVGRCGILEKPAAPRGLVRVLGARLGGGKTFWLVAPVPVVHRRVCLDWLSFGKSGAFGRHSPLFRFAATSASGSSISGRVVLWCRAGVGALAGAPPSAPGFGRPSRASFGAGTGCGPSPWSSCAFWTTRSRRAFARALFRQNWTIVKRLLLRGFAVSLLQPNERKPTEYQTADQCPGQRCGKRIAFPRGARWEPWGVAPQRLEYKLTSRDQLVTESRTPQLVHNDSPPAPRRPT